MSTSPSNREWKKQGDRSRVAEAGEKAEPEEATACRPASVAVRQGDVEAFEAWSSNTSPKAARKGLMESGAVAGPP